MSQGVTRFLDLIKCHLQGLSKLIENSTNDERVIDAGFATLDEFLPSIKFVLRRIRLLLFQVTTLDCGVDIAKEYGTIAVEWREEASNMFLRDLESVTDARLPVTLRSAISSNMVNVAYEAAKEFVAWFHAPEDAREIIRR